MNSLVLKLTSMKWEVPCEKALYFYMFTYPVFTAVLSVGYEVADLAKTVQKSEKYYKLIIIGLLLSILLMSASILLLLYSLRNKSLRILHIFIITHFIFFFLNVVLSSLIDEINDGGIHKFGGLPYHLLQGLYIWHYVFYGANLFYFKEKLKKYHGIPFTKTAWGINVENLMYPHAISVWIVTSGYMIYYVYKGLNSAKEQRALWMFLAGGHLARVIALLFLVVSIRNRDPKFIQWYKGCLVVLIIPDTVSIALLYHSKSLPFTMGTRLTRASMFNLLIWEFVLIYLCRKRYKEKSNQIFVVEGTIKNLKNLLKFERIKKLNVKLVEGEEGFCGQGNFGTVRLGYLKKFNKIKNVTVAVKMLNEGFTTEENLHSIISEMKILGAVKTSHQNLVKFYGVTYNSSKLKKDDGSDFGLVMEFCELGSLHKFLRNHKPSAHADGNSTTDNKKLAKKFLKWAIEIANAMEFLSSLKIIHGDLAARNILLDSQECCKVSDFGLSSRLNYYQLYMRSNQAIFPWRWYPPESLCDLKFSTKSDVWAYGVLLWEIYSYGKIPWGGFEWSSDFVRDLKAGHQLNQPQLAPNKIYQNIMQKCWEIEESKRFDFTDIVNQFSKLEHTSECNEYVNC